MVSTDLRNLCNSLTSSISDTSRGKRPRVFMNSSVGMVYFNNNKKKKMRETLYKNEETKKAFHVCS